MAIGNSTNSKTGFKRAGPDREICLKMLDKGDVYGVMLEISKTKSGIYEPLSEEEIQGLYKNYVENYKDKSIVLLYNLIGKPPSEETIDWVSASCEYNSSEDIKNALREVLEKYDWQLKHRTGEVKGKRKKSSQQ